MNNYNISAQLSQIIKAQEKQDRIILEFTKQFTDFSQKILSLQERVVRLEELDRSNRNELLSIRPNINMANECKNSCLQLKHLLDDSILLEKLSLFYIIIPLITSFFVSTLSTIIVIYFLK